MSSSFPRGITLEFASLAKKRTKENSHLADCLQRSPQLSPFPNTVVDIGATVRP